ncbi:ROK family protein [Oceanibium sediminis]|uniref:ROK family protein n=1 Tax=Oceanibium sediminis TaxID=2026339 RepID=UPI000DD49461|nr:ROK family protein [Oceanibium sediminis]
MSRTALSGFAVDIGGTKTAAARITGGTLAEQLVVPTDGAAGLEAQLAQIETLLTRLGHGAGDTLGVAVTGRVSDDGRWFAVNAGTLSAIDGVPLGAALRARFGAAGCCNDAAAAALAEARFGAGQGAANFVYLTVSTGVGGGIVLNDRLVQSANGLAGHLGFMTSPEGQDICGSGRRGTVESVAGGRAIAAAAQAAGHPGADARAVFETAAGGAPWAEAIVARAARAIAGLCADTAAMLGAERIAIGGSIGLAPGFIDRVAAQLDAEPALFRVPLVKATLGADGPLLGALAHMSGENTK